MTRQTPAFPRHEPMNTPAMRFVRQLSTALDSQFRIPGTKVRFGIDPVFSLVPVIGDILTYIISAALIYTMYNHGASRRVVVLMALNSTVDALIGAIPVVGTIFDIFYRSNERNVRLLQEHYLEGKHTGSGNAIVVVILVIAFFVLAAAMYGIYKLFQWIFF